MVKKRKLYEKILAGSKNITYDEFVVIVAAFGFVLMRISGSHHIYRHPLVVETLSFQPTKDGKVKPYQLRQFLKLIETYNLKAAFEEDEPDDKEGNT